MPYGNGEEVKRYKNIELPNMLKEVEMTDFHFNVHMDGKITFEIHYEEGALPEVFPEARTRVSRAAKARSQSRRTGNHRDYGRGGYRAGNRGRAKKAPAVDSDKSAAE